MKVNCSNNNDITFNSFYNNKTIKKGLEFAAKNGTLFAATTTLGLSLTARPAAILATPNTDKESKKLAFAKSLASTFSTYLLMLILSNPVASGVSKINNNPKKYLKSDTIRNLKDNAQTLSKSKAYIFATQMFKLGIGLAAAIPKAIITAAGVPVIIDRIYQEETTDKTSGLIFKGKVSNSIAKALNNKNFQEFSKKNKDSNFPMHIIAASDTLTTGTFIYQTKKSKKIKEERKSPLCSYAAISTALSIITSYIGDNLTNKPMEKFINKFKKANLNDPKLDTYLEGIRIAKPILIVGGIYYIIIPVISTFLTDHARNLMFIGNFGRSNENNKRNNNQTGCCENPKSINISP